jgi:hypothetical protein
MKIYGVKFFGICLISISLLLITMSDGMGQTITREKIINNSAIIYTGLGAQGIAIGEDIDAVSMRFGKSKFKISRPKQTSELFKDVFKMRCNVQIIFDSLYYNEEQKVTACAYRGKVKAIIGFDCNYMTSDSVNLKNGIANFIFHYGNRNLKQLRQGTNTIYAYPDLGIAVIDDNDNDSIDLYIIFSSPEINN